MLEERLDAGAFGVAVTGASWVEGERQHDVAVAALDGTDAGAVEAVGSESVVEGAATAGFRAVGTADLVFAVRMRWWCLWRRGSCI